MSSSAPVQPNEAFAFLESITDPRRRADGLALAAMMSSVTNAAPTVSRGIIGFGTYRYTYASGRDGETIAVGFAPRKEALVIYGILPDGDNVEAVDQLGPVSAGKGCLYIKHLEDVDRTALRDMIAAAFDARNSTS